GVHPRPRDRSAPDDLQHRPAVRHGGGGDQADRRLADPGGREGGGPRRHPVRTPGERVRTAGGGCCGMTMTSSAHRSAEAAALIRGVSPVLEVPFSDDGEIELDDFRRVIRYVLGTGVTSVMFPGFAGEFYKLSEDERRLLTETLIAEARDHERSAGRRVAVIAAVQDHATRLAVRRARWSVGVGADAINLLPPHLLAPSAAAIEA